MITIQGGQHADERGTIRYVNGFDMASIRRFYSIKIPDTKIIRAWQGHKRENKYFFVLAGSFLVGSVEIDNWEKPSRTLNVETCVLEAKENKIIAIKQGHANGFRALEPNSTLLVFSDMTTEDSKNDDFRFVSDYWKLIQ